MQRRRISGSIGALLLAAALLPAAACHGKESAVSVPGQITGGDWGESPAANETLPGGFTTAGGHTTAAESTASLPGGSSSAGSTSGISTTKKSAVTRSPAAGSSTKGSSTKGSASQSAAAATSAPSTTSAPRPAAGEEIRGMWLCHLDTASMFQNKSVQQAKQALDQVMDSCTAYGMNAVFFHVRPDSNAYYKSKVFRPAKYAEALIQSGFDPLAYAVEAAHKRGLQLHAWVNPYRIGADKNYAVGSENTTYFCKYSDSTYSKNAWYYIPSSTEAQKIILDGIREIVNGYDVDGVHFDDYFYPSNDDAKIGINRKQPEAFEKDYPAGGKLSLGDWRRAAVDSLLVQAYRIVHEKKGCVFGISPSHNYQRARDNEYADLPKWLANKGYVDYLCPQIYFGFKHRSSAFDKRVQEWLALPRAQGVRLYVGLAPYKIGEKENPLWAGAEAENEWIDNPDLLKQEIEYLRARPAVSGMLFFRYRFFDTSKTEIQRILPLLKKQ